MPGPRRPVHVTTLAKGFSGFSDGVKQSLTWLIESMDASAS